MEPRKGDAVLFRVVDSSRIGVVLAIEDIDYIVVYTLFDPRGRIEYVSYSRLIEVMSHVQDR